MSTKLLSQKGNAKETVRKLLRDDRTSPIVLLLISVIFLCITTPDTFLTYINLRNVIRFASFYIIVGVGTLIVFMAGEMDMSTGSVMGMGRHHCRIHGPGGHEYLADHVGGRADWRGLRPAQRRVCRLLGTALHLWLPWAYKRHCVVLSPLSHRAMQSMI